METILYEKRVSEKEKKDWKYPLPTANNASIDIAKECKHKFVYGGGIWCVNCGWFKQANREITKTPSGKKGPKLDGKGNIITLEDYSGMLDFFDINVYNELMEIDSPSNESINIIEQIFDFEEYYGESLKLYNSINEAREERIPPKVHKITGVYGDITDSGSKIVKMLMNTITTIFNFISKIVSYIANAIVQLPENINILKRDIKEFMTVVKSKITGDVLIYITSTDISALEKEFSRKKVKQDEEIIDYLLHVHDPRKHDDSLSRSNNFTLKVLSLGTIKLWKNKGESKLKELKNRNVYLKRHLNYRYTKIKLIMNEDRVLFSEPNNTDDVILFDHLDRIEKFITSIIDIDQIKNSLKRSKASYNEKSMKDFVSAEADSMVKEIWTEVNFYINKIGELVNHINKDVLAFKKIFNEDSIKKYK